MFIIPEANFAKLEAAVAKLAKKAAKLGLEAPVVSVVHEQDIEEGEKVKTTTRYLFVTIRGTAPVIHGYQLLAVLEHGDSEIGNVVRVVPGRILPASYRSKPGHCDHCNTTRRRNETFVVSNGTETLQIGRNCLADFCRSPEAVQALAGYAEYRQSLEDACRESERSGGCAWPSRLPVNQLLELTIATIRTYGWVSRKEAQYGDKAATASIVSVFLTPEISRSKYDKEEVATILANVKPEDAAEAEGCLEWVRSHRDSVEHLHDYIYNLLVVLSDTSVERKHFGVACSAISAYRKHLGQEAEARRPKLPSNHIGTVKERLRNLEVEVTGTKFLEGRFGLTTLVNFVDANGNRLKWFGTGEHDLPVGSKVKLTGTVKAHEEFNGIKQTVLTRCDVSI
jgi:hypothetical protein